MATVNYSVPEDVKRVFNETFRGQNKSALIARLMLQAVEEEQRATRRAQAIESLLARRSERTALTSDAVEATRDALRGEAR